MSHKRAPKLLRWLSRPASAHRRGRGHWLGSGRPWGWFIASPADPSTVRRGENLTAWTAWSYRLWMNELLVGYARVSTEQQDLTAQRNGLRALGVGDDRICVDHGLTGTNRDRPDCDWPLLPVGLVTPWWSRSATSSSVSAAQSMIRPIRWDGCYSMCSRGGVRIRPDPTTHWSRDGGLPRRRVGCAAGSLAEPGQASAQAARSRHLYADRTCRALRRRAKNDLTRLGPS
jgi:hypothetical protein